MPMAAALRTSTSAIARPNASARGLCRTAATTVQIFIENTFRARWAGLRTRITRRDLILWLRVDAGGRIASGGLFQCSTGLADLDRAIERWLTTEVTGLPRIEAGVDHFIRVELPR